MVAKMLSNRRRARGPGRGERGAAIAELAITLPAMLIVLLVIFDFGQGFLAYISIKNAARDGARVAMESDVACSDAAVTTAAQNGASPYTVTVDPQPDTPSSGLCSVTVSYTYTSILPFISNSFSIPMIGTVGPLWNGDMSETAVGVD